MNNESRCTSGSRPISVQKYHSIVVFLSIYAGLALLRRLRNKLIWSSVTVNLGMKRHFTTRALPAICYKRRHCCRQPHHSFSLKVAIAACFSRSALLPHCAHVFTSPIIHVYSRGPDSKLGSRRQRAVVSSFVLFRRFKNTQQRPFMPLLMFAVRRGIVRQMRPATLHGTRP